MKYGVSMFSNVKSKTVIALSYSAVILFVVVSGCSTAGLNSDQLSDTSLATGLAPNSSNEKNSAMSSSKGISKVLGDIGIPVDPATGAYRACLTSDGRAYWEERLAGTNLKGLHNNWGFGSDKNGGWIPAMVPEFFNGLAKDYAAFFTGVGTRVGKPFMGKTKDFAFCGNWCGPGHPKDGDFPPAVDALDAVCRLHDLCYNKYGGKSCKCDQMLLEAISRSRPITQMSKLENAMMAYFGNSPCKGGCKVFGVIKTCAKGPTILGSQDSYRYMTEKPNLLEGCGKTFKEIAQCKIR